MNERAVTQPDPGLISRQQAEVWAAWFRAVGDPSRLLILNLLARHSAPMSVGEIVDALDIGQSTVSHHLKLLAEVRFVLVEREGTSSRWQINQRCLGCFPTTAEVVMGHSPLTAPWTDPDWSACE